MDRIAGLAGFDSNLVLLILSIQEVKKLLRSDVQRNRVAQANFRFIDEQFGVLKRRDQDGAIYRQHEIVGDSLNYRRNLSGSKW